MYNNKVCICGVDTASLPLLKEKEKEAFKVCVDKIKKHNLSMKLIDTEYTFDNNKVLFYFTADGRIDLKKGKAGR